MRGRASSSTPRAAWSSPSASSRTRTSTAAPTSPARATAAPVHQPRPITADTTSQRFEVADVDPDGRVFAAWLDKRNVAKARAAGQAYPGAALAYAWEDGDAGFADTRIALDNTCECCRLGLAFAGRRPAGRGVPQHLPGLGARSRRHHLPRSHDARTGAPRQRRRLEDRGLPASRPQPGDRARRLVPRRLVHRRRRRKGLFYARADFGRRALLPAAALVGRHRQPSRPYLLANGRRCTWCGRSSTATRWRCAGR